MDVSNFHRSQFLARPSGAAGKASSKQYFGVAQRTEPLINALSGRGPAWLIRAYMLNLAGIVLLVRSPDLVRVCRTFIQHPLA